MVFKLSMSSSTSSLYWTGGVVTLPENSLTTAKSVPKYN